MLKVPPISTITPISGEIGEIGAGITLMLVGLFVVFTTLFLIMLVIAGIDKVAGEEQAATPSSIPAPIEDPRPSIAPVPPAEPSFEDGRLTPELVAVITAAAVAALGKPVRLRGVTLINTTGSAWLAGGRSRLMGSHSPTRQHRNK